MIGSFNCFAWDICDATVQLDGSRAPFDIVLTKLGVDEFFITVGQITATFTTTDGETYRIVSGN